KKDLFTALTWSSIRNWAGATIADRGENYQKRGLVHSLALTPDGGVTAWVAGTERYATLVDFEDQELISYCTCPYEDICKHAVAVVLEYLYQLKKGADVRAVARQDARLNLLKTDAREGEFEDNHAYDDNHAENDTINKLRAFLTQKDQKQLVALIGELAGRYPNVLRDLQERHTLSSGDVNKIANSIRKEIHEISSEPGWTNRWKKEGHIPDYSQVRESLKALLERGHADEVLTLGKLLLDKGTDQIEMSNDEGETADEISSCLDIVFQALQSSALSPAEQILWAIDAELNDNYDICRGSERFWEVEEYGGEDWGKVATELEKRLEINIIGQSDDNYSYKYKRDRLCDRLISALESAGRSEEIIPLCEKEAGETGSYVRLVKRLKDAGRLQEAEQWIRKGIKDTHKKWPGIANQLRGELRDIKEREGNLIYVAALRFNDFMRSPSLDTFQDAFKAAQKGDVASQVRTEALRFLETGASPQSGPSWPLPDTGLAERLERPPKEFPLTHVLIDIAIAERRPDDVIRWYDHISSMTSYFSKSGYRSDAVASAIADSYPERALAIWKECAEGQISFTQPKAYQAAAVYLGKIYILLKKEGKEKEWQDYLARLRQGNSRKKRLLEILDGLD
ncbi:MAG: hypothetical protein C0394_09250, partial [Syntrophus sp. (in: bacteria)]|nr:hypothetical protein [Syntrophus sp. (in: bacteria)]